MSRVISIVIVATAIAMSPSRADEPDARIRESKALFAQGKAADALALLRVVAAEGNTHALFELGVAYEVGRGVAQNYEQAWNYYSDAANRGLLIAIHKQGLFHDYGWYVPKSAHEAKGYWLKAAEKGFAPSQYLLATASTSMLSENEEPNDQAAVYWLQHAADQNLPEAAYILGVFYEVGYGGLKRDWPLAYALITWSLERRFRLEPWMHKPDSWRFIRARLSEQDKKRAQSLLAQMRVSGCCIIDR